MKLRDKILYMSFGAGLVVLGMVLNSLVSGDAEAQGGVKDAEFNTVFCRAIPSAFNLSAVSLTHNPIAKLIGRSSLYPSIASALLLCHINTNNSSISLSE